MPSVKVLFMSGYTADILRKRGILDEGQGFIPKPVSPSDLLKEVRNVLDRET
jgi:two-component system cell cycle sensor histidine kinase/response regulator CckA